MSCDDSVSDPGFSQGGAPTPKVDVKSCYLANLFFPKKCMKLKEFGHWRRDVPGVPVRSANAISE